MSTISTAYGMSFAPAGYVRDAELRTKAERASTTEQARLDHLPIRCRQWADRLDVDALEAMAVVAKDYEREGMAPCRVSTSDLARRLKCDERDAEARMSRLIAAGAVVRTDRLAADPVFRPVARGTIRATKEDVILGEMRNMVADATAQIEGRPAPQRAKAETSLFPAGTLLGLARRS